MDTTNKFYDASPEATAMFLEKLKDRLEDAHAFNRSVDLCLRIGVDEQVIGGELRDVTTGEAEITIVVRRR